MEINLVRIINRQFESSYQMLYEMVEACPDEMWTKINGAFPFWQQIYHAAYWLDFWIRDVYDGCEFRSMIFDESVSFELDENATVFGTYLKKEELRTYLEKIHDKTERVFEHLNDEALLSPIIPGKYDYTYADVITGQVRHVMYHVGHCNSILRHYNIPAVEWIAHNEKRQ